TMHRRCTDDAPTMHRRFRIADRAPLRNFHPKNKLSGSLVQGLVSDRKYFEQIRHGEKFEEVP
ncbi:MAG: hypothetical protein ABGZ35_22765, partial [Planctomycetaceae bacterium]